MLINTYLRAATAGIILLAGLILMRCSNDLSDVEELVSRFDTTVEEAMDVEILYSDSAVVKVRITGPRMLNYIDRRDNRQEFPDGVRVEFFDREQEIESVVIAQYGLRQQNLGKVIVRDSVVWTTADGQKLETEELEWDEREQLIHTNKFVVITRPDEVIYGHGFEASQDFSYSRIMATEGRMKIERPAEGFD